MNVKQISVLLDNTPGTLAGIRLLGHGDISAL